MTPLQRKVLECIARGVRRPQSRHASRATNELFRLDYLTDIDSADNRHAIGGCYLTPAGLKALVAPAQHPKPKAKVIKKKSSVHSCIIQINKMLESCKRGQTLLEATTDDDVIARIHEIYGSAEPSGTPANAGSRILEEKSKWHRRR